MSEGQRIHYLYGATTQPEFLNFVRTQCILDSQSEVAIMMERWKRAAQAFASISALPDATPETVKVSQLPNELEQRVRGIADETLFKNSFSMLPISFEMVEIDKLVAGQRYVNLDYVSKLVSNLPSHPTPPNLIDFCLAKNPEVPPPAELQLAQNIYSYRSSTTDFRFLGGFPKRLNKEDLEAAVAGGLPVAGILLLVGYGSPSANVFKVGQRFILNNGFHRLFALRTKGINSAPVVVQHITNSDLELPPQLLGLPTKYLVESRRPSMMQDFFDESLVIELIMKARDRSVQVQWNANQIDIPK